ncbi:MAG TPA: ATP-binding protein, partial [Gemmatimonadales bacterium]|nr:ATP-binding protein [Gemmatimonadales bacterium]
ALIRASDKAVGGIEDLELDGDRLWLTTFREGLALYRGGHLTVFGSRVPSLLREAHRVLPDGLGFLWISSNLGLQRVRTADLLAVAQGRPVDPFIEDFDRDDGLLSAEFNSTGGASGARSYDGHLWFPSPVGLVEVDPQLFRADTAPPRAVVDQVLLDDRDVTSEVGDRLSWRGGRLTIRYTTPAMRKSRSQRFRYQLVGVDPGWVEAGPVREAIYPNLRGGEYTFRVQAGPGGGLWPSRPVELEVRLAPKLYEQRWFLILVITLAAALVAVWYRWRTRQLVLQSRRLEQLVAARTRELEASRDELDHRVQERTMQLEAELAERQRLEQQLAQASKLESVGRLAGGVAHDINNLMTAVLGYAQLVEESAPDIPGLKEDLRQIRLAGERAAGVSQQLLAFGRRQIFNPRVVNLNEILFGLDTMLRKSVGASIELVVLPGEELWNVRVDPVQLEQVIINLVANARDAMPGGGKLWLATRDVTMTAATELGEVMVPPGEYVELTVRDTGSGVPPEVLPHIFEPFFTTKEVGQGTGLGLATSYGIVKQSGGHIIVESDWGKGAIFRVLLPRSLEESRDADTPTAAPAVGGSETILLVEDEPQLRVLASRFLRRIGYTVLEAADGEEALRVVADRKKPVDAMITDLIMPRMGGLELATRMRAAGQRCRIVLVSGYVEREVPPELIRQPGVTFLAKPFRLQELARRLRTLLDGPPPEV